MSAKMAETTRHELVIEVKNMCKNFGPTRALRNVDVAFYRGRDPGAGGRKR